MYLALFAPTVRLLALLATILTCAPLRESPTFPPVLRGVIAINPLLPLPGPQYPRTPSRLSRSNPPPVSPRPCHLPRSPTHLLLAPDGGVGVVAGGFSETSRLERAAACSSRHTGVLYDRVLWRVTDSSRLNAPISRAISPASSAALKVTRDLWARCLARSLSTPMRIYAVVSTGGEGQKQKLIHTCHRIFLGSAGASLRWPSGERDQRYRRRRRGYKGHTD